MGGNQVSFHTPHEANCGPSVTGASSHLQTHYAKAQGLFRWCTEPKADLRGFLCPFLRVGLRTPFPGLAGHLCSQHSPTPPSERSSAPSPQPPGAHALLPQQPPWPGVPLQPSSPLLPFPLLLNHSSGAFRSP